MKKPIFFLLGLGLALFLGACDSDSDSDSNTEKLTGQWKLTAATTKFTFMGVPTSVDVYAQLAACDKDNTIEFKTDGTTVSDEGATKCSPVDPQQTSGTWALTQNETHLVVTGADYDFDAEIVELSNSKLRVQFDEDLNGTLTTNEMVFVKI